MSIIILLLLSLILFFLGFNYDKMRSYFTNNTENNNSSNIENKDNSSIENNQNSNNENNENNQNSNENNCMFNKKILTYVGQNNRKIECIGAKFESSDESIVSITSNGIIIPKKIGVATIKLINNNEINEILVYVDHQKIEKDNNVLVLYNIDNASSLSTDYAVYVKIPSEENYHPIQVFKAQVSSLDMDENLHSSFSSYTNFDFKGTVNIKVIPKRSFTDFRLRGSIYSQNSKKNGNEIVFNLTNQGVISLETKNGKNYDTKTNLHIFANKLDENFSKIDLNDPNTIYLGPGEHKCANNTCSISTDKNILIEKRKADTSSSSYPAVIELKSNSILYISGSSNVHSQIKIDKWNDNNQTGTMLSNVKIYGRGTIDTSDLIISNINSNKITFTNSGITSGLVRIVYSKNITIDGVILKNAKGYSVYVKDSDNIAISNLKIISSGKNTDGIHVLSSRTINVNNAFIRTCDDGVAIYSSRGSGGFKSGSFVGLNGNSNNMKFNNLLMWIDNGSSVNIGSHGNYDSNFGQGNKIENIAFTKMRILETDKRIDYEGTLSVESADNNYVSNISFNNVTVDNIIRGNLINIKNYCSNYSDETYQGTKANKCGYLIENISFNDVNWNGKFDNVTNIKSWINIAGKKISNTSECSTNNLDHVVTGITFKNIKLGNITLSESNKNDNYSNIPIYKSNNCVFNQIIN